MKGQPGHTSARPLPPVLGSDRVQRQVALQREGPDEVLKAEAAELAMVPSGAGGSIRLSDPLHDANNPDEEPSTTPVQIAAVAPRSTGADQRKGFDTRGEALAFAVARAGGTGAGVVQRGKLFFVFTFIPNPDFVRTKVYAYTAAQGILSAVGHAATTRKAAAEGALATAKTELDAAEKAWLAQKNVPASTARTDALLEFQARERDWAKATSDLDLSQQDYNKKFATYMNLPEELQAQAAERRLQQAGGPQL